MSHYVDLGQQVGRLPIPIGDDSPGVLLACAACRYSQVVPPDAGERAIDCPRCCTRLRMNGGVEA